jgi:hypothetical protein
VLGGLLEDVRLGDIALQRSNNVNAGWKLAHLAD